MRDAAAELNIPRHAPEDINSAEGVALLASLKPDLLMVCDYGQILSKEALSTAPMGGINLHGSLLPKYRGAAPVHWAVYNGDPETGISVIHMTTRLDGGPILTERRTPIEPNETTETLEPRLAILGAAAVLEAIEMLAKWDGESVIGNIQDAKQTTKAPRLHKSQGVIDWTESAEQIHNQIRAFQPWPGSYTFYRDAKQKSQRLTIRETSVVVLDESPAGSPGEVLRAEPDMLAVATGDKVLQISVLQPAGKRAMSAGEFLNGCRIQIGDVFANDG